MIKQIELRVGNFVDERAKNKFCEVHTICRYDETIKLTDSSGYLYETALTQIAPIQLTPDILKMAGFQTGDEDAAWHILPAGFTHFVESNINGYCEVYIEDIDNVRVRFLHQLQNVYFFITGKELSIRL